MYFVHFIYVAAMPLSQRISSVDFTYHFESSFEPLTFYNNAFDDGFWIVILQIQSGHTALTYAASGGHTDCVRMLLDGGANIESRGYVRLSGVSC